MLSDQALKLRITQIFKRSCPGTSQTNVFDELPSEIRSALSFKTEPDEVHLLGSFVTDKSWVLVTSRRLIWRWGEDKLALPWQNIKHFEPTDLLLKKVRSSIKESSRRFTVQAMDGSGYEFETEAGSPFMAMWNAIRAMIPAK